jgi:hypothetical protein
MIPKSRNRFSEKIMLKQKAGPSWWPNLRRLSLRRRAAMHSHIDNARHRMFDDAPGRGSLKASYKLKAKA